MSESYQEMLREMTTQVIVETGLTESIAHKCAVAVMTVLQEKKAANGLLYVSAPTRHLDLLQIEQDFRAGRSVRFVCRKYRISRQRLLKEFPNGLPQQSNIGQT